jgi:hypothetical protein
MSKTKQILRCSVPFLVIIILGLLPILSAMLAEWIASLFGVHINEANEPDIPVIGGLLGTMYVMGWCALGTIPLAALALLIYMGVFIVRIKRILLQDSPEPAVTDEGPNVVERRVSRRRFLGTWKS